MAESSIVRENLMKHANYTPYCGSYMECSYNWPRTTFNGSQFRCRCGWKSKFEPEFIEQYKAAQEKLRYVSGVEMAPAPYCAKLAGPCPDGCAGVKVQCGKPGELHGDCWRVKQPPIDGVREAEIELADMQQNGDADDVLAAKINLENVRHAAKQCAVGVKGGRRWPCAVTTASTGETRCFSASRPAATVAGKASASTPRFPGPESANATATT